MNFDPNTDYSILLRRAMESGADKETVQDLLNKRTEKALSDPNLVKYANDDVYRQALSYIAQAESSQPDAYEIQLEQARQEAVASREEQTKMLLDELAQQEGTIHAQAKQDRTAAYAAARLSALGGEEELAALGLGQGVGSLSSGYQESSRIARDTALQNNIGGVNAAETEALRQLAAEIRRARQTGLADVAALEEEYRMRYADYLLRKEEQKREEEERLYQRQQDAWQNYYQQAQWEQTQKDRLEEEERAREETLRQQEETDYQRRQDEYDAAFKRWQLTGVVSEEDAPILGVPAGTPTASYRAQLYSQGKSSYGTTSASGSGKKPATGTTGSEDPLKTAKSLVSTKGASAACAYLQSKGYSGASLRTALRSIGLSESTIAKLVGTVIKPGVTTGSTGQRTPTAQ